MSNLNLEDLLKNGLQPSVTGYMCYIDYCHELGNAAGGNKVYPSLDDLYKHHPMADECGIVEVEVSVKALVKPPEH